MGNIAVDSLSKETRKLRKKKPVSDNESDDFQPVARKSKERRMSARISSSSSSSCSPTYADVASVSLTVQATVLQEDEHDDTQDASQNPEPPGTPIPQLSSLEIASGGDSDSVDGYDTDELLEQIDQLGPLRIHPATTTGVTKTSNKKKKNKKRTTGRGGKKKAASQQTRQKKASKKPLKKPLKKPYNHERTQQLKDAYPDQYWQFNPDNSNMIGNVNQSDPLEAIHSMTDQGPVLGMALSEDGLLLATFCTMGTIKIWDIRNDFALLRKLRDASETQIDEFYCGLFKNRFLLAGGKLKDRTKWSYEDDDCHILPCPIKIFDMENGKVVGHLAGHEEEILCIKSLQFEQENYYISTSQDGYIIKWHVGADWTTLNEYIRMDDGVTCMAFTVSFIPNTGNKYFIGACDAHLRLYDFENAQLLQTFEGMYSSYCDCGRFINWIDEKYYWDQKGTEGKKRLKEDDEDETELVDIEEVGGSEPETYAWVISRGAELVDSGDDATIPNSCALHRLVYPKKSGQRFELEEVKRYQHDKYHANSWLVKIASNGRYIFAPTMEGQIFVFNILTGQVTAMMKDHQDLEVRDIIVHPYLPLLFSSGDDGTVNIYTYKDD